MENENQQQLDTVQKYDKLNRVYRDGEAGPGGAYHDYVIAGGGSDPDEWPHELYARVEFQKGARKAPDARHGVLDCDLLEIVRDRLKAFQAGPYATAENHHALCHIEEALLWMNKRVEDRAAQNVLGTMNK